MIIDAHCHITEPVAPLIQEMDRHGINKAVCCSAKVIQGEGIWDLESAGNQFSRLGDARLKNSADFDSITVSKDFMNIIKPYKDRLIPMGKVDLFSGKVLEEAQFCYEQGFAGIGEIIGISQNPAGLETLIRFSHEKDGYPLFIHTDYPVSEDDIDRLFELILSYPQARVIAGHLGGAHWMKLIGKLKVFPRIFTDFSEVVNQVVVRVAVNEIPDQLLYASDSPWGNHGAGLSILEGLFQNNPVCSSDAPLLDESLKQKILYKNAQTLFRGYL